MTVANMNIVIDSLKCNKLTTYTANGFWRLEEVNIDIENSIQRAGRTGRTDNGFYILICNKDMYDDMRDANTSRIDDQAEPNSHFFALLHNHLDVKRLYDEFFYPITRQTFTESHIALERMGMLVGDIEFGLQLSTLGKAAASIPYIEPSLVNLLLLGYAMQCVRPTREVAAALSLDMPGTFINIIIF